MPLVRRESGFVTVIIRDSCFPVGAITVQCRKNHVFTKRVYALAQSWYKIRVPDRYSIQNMVVHEK